MGVGVSGGLDCSRRGRLGVSGGECSDKTEDDAGISIGEDFVGR